MTTTETCSNSIDEEPEPFVYRNRTENYDFFLSLVFFYSDYIDVRTAWRVCVVGAVQLLVRKASVGDNQGGRCGLRALDGERLHGSLLAIRHRSDDSVHRSQGHVPAALQPATDALIELDKVTKRLIFHRDLTNYYTY